MPKPLLELVRREGGHLLDENTSTLRLAPPGPTSGPLGRGSGKIQRHSQALGGICRLTFQMNVAVLPHSKLVQSIELIGNEVAPVVRKEWTG